MTMDLTVHAWDLARGIGADEELPDELCAEVPAGGQASVEGVQGAFRALDHRRWPLPAPLFHTLSLVTEPVPGSATRLVAPQPSSCGLVAGKSTCTALAPGGRRDGDAHHGM